MDGFYTLVVRPAAAANGLTDNFLITASVVFICLTLAALTLFQAVRSLNEFIGRQPGEERRRWLLTLALVVVSLAVASGFITKRLTSLLKPKILITSNVGKVLSPDYRLRWSYDEGRGQKIRYSVTVQNMSTGRQIETFTWLPYARIVEPGPLKIRVDAINNDEVISSTKFEVERYKDSIERIGVTKEMVVAVHADNSEGIFCYVNETTGDYEGIDIEIIKAIKKGLEARHPDWGELQLKIVFVPWPAVIEMPNTYDVDFSISSITRTPEREKTVLFSSPYFQTQLAVLQVGAGSAKDVSEEFTVEEFAGKRVGVHQGTTAALVSTRMREAAKESFEVVHAADNFELFSMLETKQVDLVLYDYARTHAEIAKHSTWMVRKLDYRNLERYNIFLKPEEYGIAFAQLNKELRDEVNAILNNEGIDVDQMIKERVSQRVALR